MNNEQRAHDLTMLYVKLLCDTNNVNKDNIIEYNPMDKYCEFYPKVLAEVNEKFPNDIKK